MFRPLHSLYLQGVAGFRIDAAKHMEPSVLSSIFSALDGSPYITQVLFILVYPPQTFDRNIRKYQGAELQTLRNMFRMGLFSSYGRPPVSEMVANRDVIEFGATQYAMAAFLGTSGATVSIFLLNLRSLTLYEVSNMVTPVRKSFRYGFHFPSLKFNQLWVLLGTSSIRMWQII